MRVTVPRRAAVYPGPCDGPTLGQERRPEDSGARRSYDGRVVATRKRGQTGCQRMELVGREDVQRAAGIGA